MKKLGKKSTDIMILEASFDSDDELPTDYAEFPFVAAYQDDARFDYIEDQKTINIPLLKPKNNTKTYHRQIYSKNNNEMLMEGYLNKKDFFSFHCLKHASSERTLCWYFRFLLHKDLQSNYNFLTTCLVPSL